MRTSSENVMASRWGALAVAAVMLIGMTGCARAVVISDGARLASFASEAELRAYAAEVVAERQRLIGHGSVQRYSLDDSEDAGDDSWGDDDDDDDGGGLGMDELLQLDPNAAAMLDMDAAPGWITNVQEQGVDEGGIVKLRGRYLIVMRRGRLFTIDLASGMRPVAMIDLATDDSGDAWYDEMLVVGDRILVIGYSYPVGGTEVAEFRIDAAGGLTHGDRLWLRSSDYYSSRNYASRVIGDRLILYLPIPITLAGIDHELPAVRKSGDDDWSRIVVPATIQRPLQPTLFPVLHTIVTCVRGAGCQARGVIGPGSRSVYVSATAAYVWVAAEEAWGLSDDPEEAEAGRGAVLYRLPFDGGPVGAVRVGGSPTDAFSFKERGGQLYVLLRGFGGGDAMWGAETVAGDVALLTVPLSAFGANVARTTARAYRELPVPPRSGYRFHNRFVGDHVVYGNGTGGYIEAMRERSAAIVAAYVGSSRVERLPLGHAIDRIEALGDDAVVVGQNRGGDLVFSSLALDGSPRVVSRFVRPHAQQGEERSHGFFFRAHGPRSGVLGLPIRNPQGFEDEYLLHGSAAMQFLRVDALSLTSLGTIAATPDERSDNCVVSCVDWYGNARPIFVGDRIFALMGYELIEASATDGRVREIARVDLLTHHFGGSVERDTLQSAKHQ